VCEKDKPASAYTLGVWHRCKECSREVRRRGQEESEARGSKTCSRCEKTKTMDEFYKGNQSWCKACMRERQREVYNKRKREEPPGAGEERPKRKREEASGAREKTCTKCEKTKAVDEFAGGRNMCKSCMQEYQREWRRKRARAGPGVRGPTTCTAECGETKGADEFQAGRNQCRSCVRKRQCKWRKARRARAAATAAVQPTPTPPAEERR